MHDTAELTEILLACGIPRWAFQVRRAKTDGQPLARFSKPNAPWVAKFSTKGWLHAHGLVVTDVYEMGMLRGALVRFSS